MPIIFSLVARGQYIIADASQQSGNFKQVAQRILAKMSQTDSKMSYQHDEYTFHYEVSNQLVFMCLTDHNFDRRVAFSFLSDAKQLFISRYGVSVDISSSYQFRDFNGELKRLMNQFSAQSSDRIARAKADVDVLRGAVEENIDRILDRQEKVELLVDRSESLAQGSIQFRKKSTQLKKSMWWKNCKLWIVIIIILLILIFFVVVVACGGFTFSRCRKQDDKK
ncbi:vesicle-associated membrane protein 7E [Monocercomonoides exilis]|uniref:vesicle-associated membrane protein 7E n=1 Tax=Monocercomonoides exilis TaxID=2049356 RepID=UPI003559EA85|nr:vesicle-associated membrane protein 7E [Monocercomonoides exilis]|eukprot:MONOS_609.1-p1 / transcript=MONOS_609.1 / gene=MONOS_609 / organism=Monocercomonoides_exilis_PA203 / gene_product= vesicle-associated membrane protein 7E / transcript_product= vesicle-associated membrane protein 7E / location=Mono_scaffold00009:259964-260918(-) / protein_length=223 / sequence_SO=supercontig / SO=protein_coding / is_pseudo=false